MKVTKICSKSRNLVQYLRVNRDNQVELYDEGLTYLTTMELSDEYLKILSDPEISMSSMYLDLKVICNDILRLRVNDEDISEFYEDIRVLNYLRLNPRKPLYVLTPGLKSYLRNMYQGKSSQDFNLLSSSELGLFTYDSITEDFTYLGKITLLRLEKAARSDNLGGYFIQ